MTSSGELLFGRPMSKTVPHKSEPAPEEQRNCHQYKQNVMKKYYDKTTHKGDHVEPRSYMVQTPNRTVLRRNRKHPRDIPNDVVHEKHTLAQTPTHQNTSQIESSEMKNQLMK